MKLRNIFKTLVIVSFLPSLPISLISTPVAANTPVNSPASVPTSQPKFIKPKLTFSGHTAPLRAIAIANNGQLIASGGDDNIIKVWNPSTGKLIRNFAGHSLPIKSLLITPDGQTVISSSFDETIRFWSLQTGKQFRSLREKEGIRAIALTTDGNTLISASGDKTIKYRNLTTRKIDRILKVDATALTISRDGKTLFSGEGAGKIRVWNLAAGRELRSFTPPLPKKEELLSGSEKASAPISLAISNDGKMLLSGGYDDSFQSAGVRSTDGKSFKAWNLQTGRLVHNTSLGQSLDALVINPDGKTFISSGMNQPLVLRDMKTLKPVMELRGHAGGVYGLAMSSDGKTLYTAGGDRSVKVWDIK